MRTEYKEGLYYCSQKVKTKTLLGFAPVRGEAISYLLQLLKKEKRMYHTRILLEINGIEIECDVDFDYTPEEKAVLTGPPEKWSPYVAPEVEVVSLTYKKDIDLNELLQIDAILEDIEQMCFESLEEQDEDY